MTLGTWQGKYNNLTDKSSIQATGQKQKKLNEYMNVFIPCRGRSCLKYVFWAPYSCYGEGQQNGGDLSFDSCEIIS